jgi:tRNA(fMet)-specific endonuclease VapC
VGILIDSSVLIAHERGKLDVADLLSGAAEGEGFLSAVTASELLHGVHRAQDPGVRTRRLAWVEALLTAFPVLPADGGVARVHAHLWAHLAAAGTMIGAHDLWIAATCLAHGHTIVTANVREFARVPGLTMRAPAPD